MAAGYLTGVIGILLVLALWVGVQAAWKKVFPDTGDPDALAGRLGCHGCACTKPCRSAEEES